MTKINRKAPFQKQLLDMSNAIDELQEGIVVDAYTKEEADAKFQTIEGMSDYYNDDYIDENLYTKTQADDKFQTQTAMSDYYNATYIDTNIYTKTQADTTFQATLVSSGTGQNIKTINNESILGTGNISLPGYTGNHLYVIKGEGTDAITMGDETFKIKFFGVVSSASDWGTGNKNLRTWVSNYGATWLNTLNVVLIMPGKSDIYVDQGYISINSDAEFSVSYDYHDGTQWKYNQLVTATEGYIHVDKIY